MTCFTGRRSVARFPRRLLEAEGDPEVVDGVVGHHIVASLAGLVEDMPEELQCVLVAALLTVVR